MLPVPVYDCADERMIAQLPCQGNAGARARGASQREQAREVDWAGRSIAHCSFCGSPSAMS
jgi:hypothetical protein